MGSVSLRTCREEATTSIRSCSRTVNRSAIPDIAATCSPPRRSIFSNAAADQPFFLYLAFNCPHDPLEAPEAELSSYRKEKLGPDQFPGTGYPLPRKLDEEKIARVYAMVSNIDTNIGRLLKAVADRGIAESTIVVFLTDNGPAFPRYNAGLRGLKGTTYEGGIHVPCYVRWPGRFPAGLVVDQIAAHIDITPTLLDACEVPAGTEPKLDGRSLLPLLRGEPAAAWPERTLYFQWHRGDAPEFGRSFAARTKRFKLLRPEQQASKAAAAGAIRPGAGPVRAARPCRHAPGDRGPDVSRLPGLVPRRLRDARIRADPDPDRRPAREPHAPHPPGLASPRRGSARRAASGSLK